MADQRWPPFGNDYVITTTNDVVTSRCGCQRKYCNNFYTCEVTYGGPQNRKKSALSKVKMGGPRESGSLLQNSTSTLLANLHPEGEFLELTLPKKN